MDQHRQQLFPLNLTLCNNPPTPAGVITGVPSKYSFNKTRPFETKKKTLHHGHF